MNERLASGLRWLAVAVYFVATSLGHLRFTQLLLQPRQSDWLGAYTFKDAMPLVLVGAGVALLGWIARTAWRDPRGVWATGGYWVLWAGCVALVDRTLTYSVYEYAHYPQYALLAVLVARALDPRRTGGCIGQVLFWTTLLGMVDEWMQYLWITPSYGNYLDFNDFLVNLLGAAAGAMLYAGARRPAPVQAAHARHAWTVVVGLALALGVAMSAGRLQVSPPPGLAVPAGGLATGADGVTRLYLQRDPHWYGSVQQSPHRGAYRVLSPQVGVLVLVLLGLVFGCRVSRPAETLRGQWCDGDGAK